MTPPVSLRESLRKAVASQEEIEADEEREDAVRATGCTPVAAATDRHRVKVSGVIRSVVLRPRQGVPALEAELYDGSGTVQLVWLGRREIAGIEPGRRLKVEGLVCSREGRRSMFNPRYELRARPGE
ncbi:OB-fold nucleic acid binding domain-containing protein [Cellulomonas hominis]|uniref:OB-fold nucleic acid binding domain-containing protein n=1 Tax=Cellulomonas hominis TaxID=156981 RepID=UPI001B995AC5|nr:hypothetical protein CHMI_03545 [Cellulomonas hominis]